MDADHPRPSDEDERTRRGQASAGRATGRAPAATPAAGRQKSWQEQTTMAKAQMLVDSFGDNARDTALWDAYGGPEAEVNGRLEIRLQSGVASYGGYSSVDAYDLAGSQCP